MTDQEEKDPHQFFTKARRDKTRQKRSIKQKSSKVFIIVFNKTYQ